MNSIPSSRRASVRVEEAFAEEHEVLPPLDVSFINEINRNIEEVN